jgi:hypothetical protein
MAPTMMPPIIPAIRPEKSGAPLANAMPKHKGRATKNTTILAGKSFFQLLNNGGESESKGMFMKLL